MCDDGRNCSVISRFAHRCLVYIATSSNCSPPCNVDTCLTRYLYNVDNCLFYPCTGPPSPPTMGHGFIILFCLIPVLLIIVGVAIFAYMKVRRRRAFLDVDEDQPLLDRGDVSGRRVRFFDDE